MDTIKEVITRLIIGTFIINHLCKLILLIIITINRWKYSTNSKARNNGYEKRNSYNQGG